LNAPRSPWSFSLRKMFVVLTIAAALAAWVAYALRDTYWHAFYFRLN
jgi:hypothetical protein